jgi:MYXO-CTERM domain-containing protein
MLKSGRVILICGLLGGLSCQAGLVTASTAYAYELGDAPQACVTGDLASGMAVCSASFGTKATAFSVATASYGSVSAFIQGGAGSIAYEASATASASFTDTLTIFGGSGKGVLEIVESSLALGAGSLDEGNLSAMPVISTIEEAFTFGTPFSLALSAVSASTFDGSRCDGGSLLIEKSIESLTVEVSGLRDVSYTDASGHDYRISVAGSGHSSAMLTAAPEPGAWVLGAIGLGLLWVARRRVPKSKEGNSGPKQEIASV